MNHMIDSIIGDEPWSEPFCIEPEVKTCALCKREAVVIVNNEESFCEEHLQQIVDEFPHCYDEGETLIIRGL